MVPAATARKIVRSAVKKEIGYVEDRLEKLARSREEDLVEMLIEWAETGGPVHRRWASERKNPRKAFEDVLNRR